MTESVSHDRAFVRDEMLVEQAPPPGETGLVHWLRENMFSSVTNGVMTVVSLYVIYAILSSVLPWITLGVWNANSLSECREILAAKYGDTDYACWAVLSERWNQLLFGFYPQELYWRPILALVLLFVALAPLLFDHLPRKMMIFSALYPFLMYLLVWGGSVWVPLSVIAGFAIGYFVSKIITPVAGGLAGIIALFLAPVIWWLFLAGATAGMLENIIPLSIEAVKSKTLGGFMISIVIGLSGIALSLPIGIVLALGRQSDLLIVKSICIGFIEFIRGVPLITLLFTASLLLQYFLPKGTNFDIVLRVIIMVTLFASAYMAEVIRGGLAALPRGQYEAADALGLDYWQAQKLIIMPQALKISIPGIVNTFIGLFKDTTLVIFIGIFDILGLTGAIRASTEWNGVYWELFIFVAVVFWVCCFSMSRYSQWLEQKLRTDHR
jgi:general L-amino acid transport system permease protein